MGDRPWSNAFTEIEARPDRAHDAGPSIQVQAVPEDVHRLDARAVGAQQVTQPYPPSLSAVESSVAPSAASAWMIR